jgi:hypothetical protein
VKTVIQHLVLFVGILATSLYAQVYAGQDKNQLIQRDSVPEVKIDSLLFIHKLDSGIQAIQQKIDSLSNFSKIDAALNHLHAQLSQMNTSDPLHASYQQMIDSLSALPLYKQYVNTYDEKKAQLQTE